MTSGGIGGNRNLPCSSMMEKWGWRLPPASGAPKPPESLGGPVHPGRLPARPAVTRRNPIPPRDGPRLGETYHTETLLADDPLAAGARIYINILQLTALSPAPYRNTLRQRKS